MSAPRREPARLRGGLVAATALAVSATIPCAAGVALAGTGTPALVLLPEDTAAVLVVDAARARRSELGGALVRGIAERVLAGPERGRASERERNNNRAGAAAPEPATTAPDRAAARERSLGRRLGLGRNARTVILAVTEDFATSERFVLLADGQFRASALAAVARDRALRARRHRGVAYYETGGKAAVAVVGSCLVAAPAPTLRGVIDRFLDRRSPARTRRAPRSAGDNAALMRQVRAVNARRDVWLAFVIPAGLRQEVAARTGGHSIETVAASVDLARGVRGRVRMDTSSRAAAIGISALVMSVLRSLDDRARAAGHRGWSAADKVEVRTSGPAVWIDADMSLADLRAAGLYTR